MLDNLWQTRLIVTKRMIRNSVNRVQNKGPELTRLLYQYIVISSIPRFYSAGCSG